MQSFRIRFYARYTQKRQNVMGTILVAVKHLNLGVRGPGEKPSWGGGQDQLVPGVATLDWSPDQSPGGETYNPQSLGNKANQEGGQSWVEYRSGGTRGPHPGVDMFQDLSPRVKPYCGIKCNQGLRFPATVSQQSQEKLKTMLMQNFWGK